MRWLLWLGALAACRQDVADIDGAFYDGDGKEVHCAVNLDAKAGISLENVDGALDRAAERGEVVELYAHKPGATVPIDKIEHVLAGARARGLPFVTYREMATGGGKGAGLALSFDDASIAEWMTVRPLFMQYDARVTFFVSRYVAVNDDGRGQLRELANDGHEIAAHTVNHLSGPAYVEEYGMAAYLADEVLPSIEILRADGYEVTSFAYPFGARTGETDRAILEHVPIVRSVEFPTSGAFSPCPH